MSPSAVLYRLPEWIPVTATGQHWQLISFRGRHLGTVLKLPLLDDPEPYYGKRECCRICGFFSSMDDARWFVEKTLNCSECAEKIVRDAFAWNQTRIGQS